MVHYAHGVLGGSGGDVRQGPGSLELEGGVLVGAEETHEPWDDVPVDYLVDGGVLPGKEVAELGCHLVLQFLVVTENSLDHLLKVLHGRYIRGAALPGGRVPEGRAAGGVAGGEASTLAETVVFLLLAELDGGLLTVAAGRVAVDALLGIAAPLVRGDREEKRRERG